MLLKEFGVTENVLVAKLDKMAEDALNLDSPQNNWKATDYDIIKKLYLEAYGLKPHKIDQLLSK